MKLPPVRQQEALVWAGWGLKDHEIAKRMGISRNTVIQYLNRGREKLQVSGRKEALFALLDYQYKGD